MSHDDRLPSSRPVHRAAHHPRRRWRRQLGAFALLLAACTAAQSAPLDDLRRLIEQGQFEPAYALAMQNRQLAGDVHFDFLYGVAAINVGRVPEGVLALERHLEAVPANDRARLELARGYFLLGEYTRARSEFEFVLRYDPPAGVKATIERFLQAMQLREVTEGRATARLYAELGAGYDSNVNGGTFRDEVDFAFGRVSLVGSPSQEVSDSFAQVSAGAFQQMRVSSRLSVFGGVDVDHRENADYKEYNLSTLAGNVGFAQLAHGGLYRLTLSGGTMLVGGNRYRDMLTVGLEGTFTPAAAWQLTLFGQYGELRYHGADEVRDGRLTNAGAMLMRQFDAVGGSAGIRLAYTLEDNLRLRQDLDRKLPLVRFFAAFSPAQDWRFSAGLTLFAQRFGAEDIGFGTVRDDSGVNLDAVLSWNLTPQWSLRAEYAGFYNRSNQDLYDTQRHSLALKARYQY